MLKEISHAHVLPRELRLVQVIVHLRQPARIASSPPGSSRATPPSRRPRERYIMRRLNCRWSSSTRASFSLQRRDLLRRARRARSCRSRSRYRGERGPRTLKTLHANPHRHARTAWPSFAALSLLGTIIYLDGPLCMDTHTFTALTHSHTDRGELAHPSMRPASLTPRCPHRSPSPPPPRTTAPATSRAARQAVRTRASPWTAASRGRGS